MALSPNSQKDILSGAGRLIGAPAGAFVDQSISSLLGGGQAGQAVGDFFSIYLQGSLLSISQTAFTDPRAFALEGYNKYQQPVGYVNTSGEFVDTRLSKNIDQIPFAAKSDETREEVDSAMIAELGKPSISSQGPPGRSEQVSKKPFTFTTPIEYYLTGAEVYLPSPAEGFFGVPIEQIKTVRADYNPYIFIVDSKESKDYMKKTGRFGFYDDIDDSDYGFRYNLEDDLALNSFVENNKTFTETPHENEDPLYTSFEIKIKRESSPLFNGEAYSFLNKFKSGFNTELQSRIGVLKEFCGQMERFFKFDLSPGFPNWAADEPTIFATPNYKKRYYVKGISGLDKLTESNTANTLSSFVKYRSDLITLTFQEDTSLSLATLFTLYKQLYWSRLHGKGMLPENILRFDCEIVVSEVRNLTRLVKDVYQGKNVYRTLHDNVSRYVYDVYECQLFIDKLTHGDTIQLDAIKNPEGPAISFSFKYSNLKFERFNFAESKYKRITDKFTNVQKIVSYETSSSVLRDGDIIADVGDERKPIAHGIYGADSELMKGRPDPSILTFDGIPPEPGSEEQSAPRNTSTGAEGLIGANDTVVSADGTTSDFATPVPPDITSGVSSFNDLSSLSTPLQGSSETSSGGGFLDKLKSNQKVSDFLAKSNVGNEIPLGGPATSNSPNPSNNLLGKLNQTLFKSSETSTTTPANNVNKFKLLQESIGKVNTSFLKNQNTSSQSAEDKVSQNSKLKDALGKFGGESLASKIMPSSNQDTVNQNSQVNNSSSSTSKIDEISGKFGSKFKF
jgi:hypothetical protein